MNWNTIPFEVLYTSIENDDFDLKVFENVLSDLQNLNLNNNKLKNQESRSILEKGKITVSDGSEYKLSQEFIVSAIKLSDELNLDEIVTCELMLSNLSDLDYSKNDNLLLINNGKVQYYMRRQYILQIVSYIVNCMGPNDPTINKLIIDDSESTLLTNILPAFKSIHSQLNDIKQMINRAQILEQNDILFKQSIKFRRDFLLKEYDILGQILYGLTNLGLLLKKESLLDIIKHVVELDANDYFIIYYLPALFLAFNNLEQFKNEFDVKDLYSQFIKDLKSDDNVSSKPIKATLVFVFLTFFISWCKTKPSERAASLDFKTDIDEPMMLAVEFGAFEQLLAITAETSIIEKDKSIDLFYDIRSLLQRHIPRLIPKHLLDNELSYDKIGKQNNMMNMSNNGMSLNNSLGGSMFITGNHSTDSTIYDFQPENIHFSEQIESFFLSATHIVLQRVITDCAFLLTKIKDAEEDSLLSGEDLDLDDICEKADLERFFITLYFFYASRPEYSKEFLEDKESNAYGFIEWAAKCSDSFMRSCFYLLVSSLSFGPKNSTHIFQYFGDNNLVSWKLIAQCISDYIVKINNFNNLEQQRNQNLESTDSDALTLALEEGLNEETIIFLSSLLTLIGSVAHDVDESVKQTLSLLFMDILFEFSKLNTPLVGACLKTLSHLVPVETKDKMKFWLALDSMIFKSSNFTNMSSSYATLFSSIFTNFTEILGFLNLFNKLIQNTNTEEISFGKLEFPVKLGQGYRKVGIVPYFDFITHNIFVPSSKIVDNTYKEAIQIPVLEIFNNSLQSFDYNVILNAASTNTDLNKLVVTSDFFTYVQESPVSIMINYLLEEPVFKGVFNIIQYNVSDLTYQNDIASSQTTLVKNALNIIDRILEFQETYTEELVPIVKKHQNTNYMIPRDFGTHGLRSFYDAIFFNLDIIAHLGLYVGIKNYSIASKSVAILNKLSLRYAIDSPQQYGQNKLLVIFDAVDESARIKDGFISQLESPIDSDESLNSKLEILEFLNGNLSYTDQSVTVSHSLLGFQVTNILSTGPKLSTFIASDSSLFKTVLFLLQSSLESIDSTNIQYAPMRLASLNMEILLKLCRNPVTSKIVSDVLLEYGFFESVIQLDPAVTKYTRWEGQLYHSPSVEDIDKFINSSSIGALLSFLCYRNHLIQYLSLFIHRISLVGTGSQLLSYIDLLISNTMYSAKVFSFLNTLGFKNIPVDKKLIDSVSELARLPLDLTKVKLTQNCTGPVFDVENINNMLKLFKKSHEPVSNSMILTVGNEEMNKYNARIDAEIVNVRTYVVNFISGSKLNKLQLSILHSWVQLVQILVSDGKLGPLERSNFVLEIFSVIIPKINDYVEFDIRLSEDLVSLAVFLYDVYNQDRLLINKKDSLDGRLQNLFKVCIHGITSPLSSVSLRSDFYVLANQYLVRVLNDNTISGDILQSLRVQSERFVEAICNDAIYGESTSRITAILLLDSLVQIANSNRENIILDALVKNTQLHLIIRTLKNVDRLINSKKDTVSIDNLLYEITAFKAITYFLVHIAETRNGAQCLIQNKVLQVIGNITFLRSDPDLGLTVFAEDKLTQKAGLVEITLDEKKLSGNSNNNLSLKELIIPIFKLLTAVLISAGNQNHEVIKSVKGLLVSIRKLLICIFKYDTLEEKEGLNKAHSSNELVKLTVLLCSLTNYYGENIL